MKILTLVLIWANFLFMPALAQQVNLEEEVWGKLPDGREVQLFTLRNASGMQVQVTNYGAYLVSFTAPDRQGKQENIVLGVPTLADYLKGTPNFGPVVGRFANRIGGAKFTLDGTTYTLAANNRSNHIHGGRVGFDKKLWTATPVLGPEPAVILQYTSPDGEEGYPGTLTVEVTYTLLKDDALRIDYRAKTDKPTVVNLTNHAYFNLTGMKRDVLNHVLQINANQFLPTDEGQIPTGAVLPVAGTPLDFRKPTPVGQRINDTTNVHIRTGFGYDHCWVFTDGSRLLKLGATLYEPESGRLMELYTTEPGVQVYTGNHLNGRIKGREGVPFTRRFGICLETQHFPDSPNKPQFPTTTLRPGEEFRSTTVFRMKVK
ncbi:aldose epimerase family protein [Tellurirhabdus rosea]|uniref:aldose epimerase family protein n=1 Tax=Tellurirhabdus rosea TaxID=2674997 RepID=UPI00225A46F0|nr:aldose epimerase family protein [Tellurirhabdus rosea]